jgi:hypothetical protein
MLSDFEALQPLGLIATLGFGMLSNLMLPCLVLTLKSLANKQEFIEQKLMF